MLDTLFWVAVGAFVGWNFPQPFWAKIIQEKIQAMIAKKGAYYEIINNSNFRRHDGY
jgi:hypothetical protein